MTVHELKIEPVYLNQIIEGIKTFEIRKNDRDFQIEDTLILHEYFRSTKECSGRHAFVKVVYISCFMQQKGNVVLGIKLLPEAS